MATTQHVERRIGTQPRWRGLTRTAVGVVVVSVAVTAVVGYGAYRVSHQRVVRMIGGASLQMARSLGAAAEVEASQAADSSFLDRLARAWESARSVDSARFLCVVGSDGRVVLHTGRSDCVGMDVGGLRIEESTLGGARTVGDVLAARKDWFGAVICPDGQHQLLAMAYNPKLNGLICVHTPVEEVGADIQAAAFPWIVGLGVPVVLLLIGIGVVRRSYVRVHDAALEKQAALDASREHLARIESLSPVMVTEEELDGRWRMVSPEFCELLGCTEAELLTQPVAAAIRSEDLESDRLLRDRLLRGECLSGDLEMRFVRKDRRDVWVYLNRSLVKTPHGTPRYFVTYLRNITKRKQMEDRLAESERMHRTVVEALDEGMVLQDAQGAVIACNPAAQRILGLTAEQMMGRTELDTEWIAIYEDGELFSGHEHPAKVTLKTGTPCRDTVMGLAWPDGSITWISMNTTPVFSPGQDRPHMVITTFRDITAHKHTEERLKEATYFLEKVIDSLPYEVAVLDESGNIVSANSSWTDSVENDHFVGPDYRVGRNYLDLCEHSDGAAANGGHTLAQAIREVIAGQRPGFWMEYPLELGQPGDRRWFQLRINRCRGLPQTRVLVIHEDITNLHADGYSS